MIFFKIPNTKFVLKINFFSFNDFIEVSISIPEKFLFQIYFFKILILNLFSTNDFFKILNTNLFSFNDFVEVSREIFFPNLFFSLMIFFLNSNSKFVFF